MTASCVFLFTVPMSPLFSYDDEAVESAASMAMVAMPDMPRYVVRDPEFVSDLTAGSICDALGAKTVDIHGPVISSRNYGCYVMSMLKSAMDTLYSSSPSPATFVSVPACWKCVSRVSLSRLVHLVGSRDDVFSVFVGGCPTAHTDSCRTFDLQPSTVNGYLKLRVLSWDYPGLDRLSCPSVVSTDKFSSLCMEGSQSLNKISGCGWKNSSMVLYPDSLSSSPFDGKLEPFRDIVGTCPVLWDKYSE